MSEPNQLPYLMKLLKDDSPGVRRRVMEALSEYGPQLDLELERQELRPDDEQWSLLRRVRDDGVRNWLRTVWPAWMELDGDKRRLETALSFLADFQGGRARAGRLHSLLDSLADEFTAYYGVQEAEALAWYLFREKGLEGAREDYYNPLNSSLVHVIDRKRGIPISLCAIFILVGHRLNLDIEGCNLPGHFVARIYRDNRPAIVDCFNGGLVLTAEEQAELHLTAYPEVGEILRLQCGAEDIVMRVLRNLINAYQLADDEDDVALMTELLQSTEAANQVGGMA